MPNDLTLLMPVYNEESRIKETVQLWLKTLSSLDIQFQILIVNDGSTDATESILKELSADQRVLIRTQKNHGHGPAILSGYRQAVEKSAWVFQCDSDHEISDEHFPALWARRNEFDALLGIRQNRSQHPVRKWLSLVSRLTILVLFKKYCADVNTPYRLMRSDILKQFVGQIPADTFAPNVILTGSFLRNGLKVYTYPVSHQNKREKGKLSHHFKIFSSAFKSFRQTLSIRPAISQTSKEPISTSL